MLPDWPLYVLLPALVGGAALAYVLVMTTLKASLIVLAALMGACIWIVDVGSQRLGEGLVRCIAFLVLLLVELCLWLVRMIGEFGFRLAFHFGWLKPPFANGDAPATAPEADNSLEILGLQPGFTRDELNARWKELMQAVHPDKAGSEWMAKQVNAARDKVMKQRGWK